MQYTKPMIDLVYEIRRRASADMKPGIKLANPEMLQELAGFYHHCKDTITKALIKELLHLAGDIWPQQIEQPQSVPNKQVTKVYRGQISLVDAKLIADVPTPASRPQRIYRGQIVDY